MRVNYDMCYRSAAKPANQRAIVRMSSTEVAEFVAAERTAILATVGKDGRPHLSAMWFAIVDRTIIFETKRKSQKAVNARRDPRVTVLIETGDSYPELRGVAFDGTVSVIDNQDEQRGYLRKVARAFVERYESSPRVPADDATLDEMLYHRVVLELSVSRIRSWDHRKLTPLPQL